MDPEHRKIELQSPADLTYLMSQIRLAARQKLDLHLPPVSDSTEPDELRKSVEELVESFVAQVLQGMRHNISINGIDVVTRGREGDEVDERGNRIGMEIDGEGEGESLVEKEEFEAFDEKLRGRLGEAVKRRDALVSKISMHRRTTPLAAAQAWQEQWESEERVLEKAQAEMEKKALAAGEQDGSAVERLERQEEVERNWERAVDGLGRLNKGLPETRARLERAGDVVRYLSNGDGGKR
jgi:kinetochor protein Mis14/NSL1